MAAATGTVVISQGGSNFDSATYPRFVLGDGTNSLTFVIDNDARGLKLTGGGDADGYSGASDLPFEDSQKTRLVVPTFDEADGAKKALLSFWITDEATFDDAWNGVDAVDSSAITAIGTRPHFVLRDAGGSEIKIGGGNADATSLSNSGYTLLAKYSSSGSPRFWLYKKDSAAEYFIRIVTTGSSGFRAHTVFGAALKHAADNSLIDITTRGVLANGTLTNLANVANNTYTASEIHGLVLEYDTAGFAGNACYMEFKDPNTDFSTSAKQKCMSWGYSEYATTNVYTINRHSLSPTNDQFWGTNLNSKIWFRQGTIAGSGSDASLSTANIAEAIKEMINGSYLGITATRSGSTVNLTNDTDGDSGNVDITTTNKGSLFTVSGMSNAGGESGSEDSDVARRSTISADQLALSASGGLASSSDNKSAIKLDLSGSLSALGASPASTDLLAVAHRTTGVVTKITVSELIGAIAAGSDTQVQFNQNGSLAGSSGLTFNGSGSVTVGNDLLLASDSAILSLGAGADATLTHDGTTGLTIAATPISIDSTGELHLNSTTGDIKLQDGGVDQIAFDLDGTAGEVIMKPAVDSDDLVFAQYDGTEVIRIEDNGAVDFAGGAGSSGVTITAAGQLTADGRVIIDDATEATTTTDGSLQTDGGLSVAKSAVVGDDLDLLSDSAILNFGADKDVNLTHVADTGLLLNSTRQLQFGDSGTYIHQSADGVLDLVSDTEIEINATTIDVNGAIDASSTITAAGRVIVDDTTEATSTTDGSLQTDGGLSVAKDIIAGDDVFLLSDSAVLGLGAGKDVTITHDGGTGATLASAGAFLIDGANAVSIDGASGVNIGTNDSGAAISIGHTTSEVTVNDNLTVTGDLKVNGSTTTVNTTNLLVEDAIIQLGSASHGSSTADGDRGLIFSQSGSVNPAFWWDQSASEFVLGRSSTSHTGSAMAISSPGDYLDLTVGKLSFDSSASDYIDLATHLKVVAAADIVLNSGGNVVPNADDGGSLGDVSKGFSDLYLASGGKLDFAQGDVTVTHAANVLTVAGGALRISDDTKIEFGTGADASFEYDEDGTDTLLYSGASMRFADDTKLEFGVGGDASFEYDEDGNDVLLYAGADMRFGDDIKLQFGAGGDASFEYDEDGNDVLLYAGADMRFGDDIKLQFGAGGDATIEYDEDGTDELRFAGAAVTFEQAVTFDGAVTLGNAYADTITSTGPLSASAGIAIADDKQLVFGTNTDARIYYDEDGTDRVVYTGAGLRLDDDTKLEFGIGGDASFEYDEDGNDVLLYAGANLRISDDVKIEFGSGGDAGIEYDEDCTDQLRIHQPAAGVVIAGTNPKLVLGDAGAEDTMLVFDGNAQDFRIGLDDGTDILELGVGSTHGTTTSIKMDASRNVDIAAHDGSTGLKLAGTLVAASAAELNAVADVSAAGSYAGTVDVSADHFIFRDGAATGANKIESIADLVSGVASNGLQASSGQLSITSVEDHFVSSSSTGTGGTVFTLSQTASSAAAVSVYVNGIFQVQSGSLHASIAGGDYSINGSFTQITLVDANAIDASDEVVIKYIQK